MTRPDLSTVPSFYTPYVEFVKDMDVLDALRTAEDRVQDLLMTIPEEKGTYRYGEGKWSLKEVLNHMMDAERVFVYRALRFSRSDQTPLHAFEENDYAPRANAHARTIAQLAQEMQNLRTSTIDLYASFTPEVLSMKGTASNKEISVLSLGYVIAGHDLHHLKIIAERYLHA